MSTLLEIQNLKTYFFTRSGLHKAIRGIDLSIDQGKTLALVGESGCGKSMTALSLLRLVPPPGRVVDGRLIFEGEDLLALPAKEMRRIRGNRIAMIFQEPMTALNPVFRIERQITEVLRLHRGMDRKEAASQAEELLVQVGIPSPRQRLMDYPHQLSGGLRQRVMIAMALACDPRLLIADEPTTALDVTIQAQIMDLLARLKQERSMATLLISHDLGIVAEMADQVAIMYDGLIIEQAPTATLFRNPVHPYTQNLLSCIPRLGQRKTRLATIGEDKGAGERSFLHRCAAPFALRGTEAPPLTMVDVDHRVRRWES